MKKSETKSILLIEPDQETGSRLAGALTKEGYAVLLANDAQKAMQQVQQMPDLIIVEASLPDMNSFELIRTLKQNPKFSSIPFFFISEKSDEADEIIGLEIGADDYITKPILLPRLFTRIRAFFRRKDQSQQILQDEQETMVFDGFTILLPQYSVTSEQGTVEFPKKEFELLVYMAKNRGLVLTRQALFNAIWGKGRQSLSRTIDVHIGRIRRKLNALSDYIETVPGIGYRFRG